MQRIGLRSTPEMQNDDDGIQWMTLWSESIDSRTSATRRRP
jgi:hypothetical protein